MIIICKKCGLPLPEEEFHLNRTGGREYRKSTCRSCDNAARGQRMITIKPKSSLNKRAAALREYRDRKNPSLRYKFAYRSAVASDRKKKWSNDLSYEWVRITLLSGCAYCGEMDQLQMTLDRKDNALPHMMHNCAPACRRCNYFRRDMPYHAWMELVPTMKRLRESGQLDGWHCSAKYGVTQRKYE
jgi:hypothetical protein